MTTDRTALEAARDALSLSRDYVEASSQRMYDGTNGHGIRQEAKRRLVIVDEAIATVTAALSSPPVLPAEQVVGYVMKSGHGTHFLESITDAHRALSWAGRPMWRPVVYAAPQEAAPALDDARAHAVLEAVLREADRHALPVVTLAALDKAGKSAIARLQQEPRS